MVLRSLYTLKSSVPLAVVFIAGANFFKQFFDQGTFAIIPLYVVDILDFSQQNARWYYHFFCMLGSSCTLLAGLLGDSSLGKYRTIICLIVLATAGGAILVVASAPFFDIGHRRLLTYISILATSLGSACSILLPLGADQFASPQDSSYFSLMFVTTTTATLLSAYAAPILRHNFQCFGQDTCFPLAFLVLDVMLVASLVVFLLGRRHYICKRPERNIVMDVIRCACYALSKKVWSTEEKKPHWLDHAADRYSRTLVADTKAAFRALWLMLPVPIFWALDDQTGSTWVFQAVHMDGSLGRFTIKPDQMQLLDALLTLMLVPLFDLMIYPQLAKRQLLTHPLQRLTVAALLITASFVLAAIVEMNIQATLPQLPGQGVTQLRVFNGINCDVKFAAPLAPPGAAPLVPSGAVIPSLDALQLPDVPLSGAASFPVLLTTAGDCYLGANRSLRGSVTLQERQASSLFLHIDDHNPVVSQVPGFDRIDKRVLENPKLRILYNLAPFESELTLTNDDYNQIYTLEKAAFNTTLDSVLRTGKFSAKLGNASVSADIQLGPAGIYTLILHSYNDTSKGRLITVTPPNSVHMLWQMPQIIVITVAEVMFTVTANELSYTQVFEYLFYAGLMVFGTCLFKYISGRHQYYDPDHV